MPHFSIGATNYNLRNPNLQLPRIKHEFPKFSLRYQLINKLNETSPEILELAKNCTQSILYNIRQRKYCGWVQGHVCKSRKLLLL